MEFIQLTPEQRQRFDEDGFLVVRNALDGDSVSRLVEEGDQLAQSFLRKPEVPHKPEYNHIDLRQGLLTQPTLRALVTQSSTVPLVVQLLSPNIHLNDEWDRR